MAVLTAVLTHLASDVVEAQLAHMRSLSPASRFVVCHGGKRADFEALHGDDAIFIEDPSLRGPHFDKSLNETLTALYERFVRDDPEIDLVYAIEYDHLILREDFEQALVALAASSPAGLFAKSASRRNDSNWSHYLKARGDERLDEFVRAISTRDDPTLRFGCLGTGLLLRRDALAAFCSLTDPPPAYVEMFVPTAIYHLGFDVADFDALGDLYRSVRWVPEFTLEEALAEQHAGRTFVHPFKRLELLAAFGGAA
jgi:hypothetical protein